MLNNRTNKRIRRHTRLRAKLSGTSDRPRVSVFRSNAHLFIQAIDDSKNTTLASATDINSKKTSGSKMDIAKNLGLDFAKKISGLGFKKIVFDRGGHKYHGRVKAFADAMRSENIEF